LQKSDGNEGHVGNNVIETDSDEKEYWYPNSDNFTYDFTRLSRLPNGQADQHITTDATQENLGGSSSNYFGGGKRLNPNGIRSCR